MEFKSDRSEQDTSRCFVPEILVDFLSKQIRLGIEVIEPATYFLHGVCLLVDISGFTKLSGDFCAQGKKGIDGLQLATNGYMGKLVETIYLFGGDIIKFAGDAIICIFPSTLITKVVKSNNGRQFRRSTDAGSTDLYDDFGNGNPNGKSRALLVPARSIRPNFLSESGSDHSLGSRTFQRSASIKPDHILRAMHCANELKSLRTNTLTVHVAISCGEMCFGVLGGYEDRWECLISGPCLEELSGCLDDAPSMQAVMTEGCLAIIRGYEGPTDTLRSPSTDLAGIDEERSNLFDGKVISNACAALSLQDYQPNVYGYTFDLEALPSGNHKILTVQKSVNSPRCAALQNSTDPKSKSDDTLHALILKFVPVLINEANRHGTGLNYLSEIREVTTMFMKWDSYDSSENYADLLVLQDCFFAAQRILHTTGAYLRQFLVDDKGCVLIACWGMPSQTYLDNAHRALTAAVEIRSALLELQMKCSFGITTGDVYCGTVGSVLRMEYAAIGSVVNMAARLMGKAHGGILIDEPTYRRVPVLMQAVLVKLPPIQVKGRAEPLQVFEHDHNVAETSMNVSGVGATIIHSADGQEDLLEVRDCCRLPFANLLRTLDGRGPLRRRSTVRDLFTSLAVNATSRTASLRMKVLLVEGKKGSGSKSSNAWLYKQAQIASIRAAHVMLVDKSFQYPYYLLYKLFTQIAPRDVYTSKISQRRYVHALLKEVYPFDGNTASQVAFPIMKQALAMTCTYSRDPTSHAETSVSIMASVREITTARSIRVVKDKKFPPKLVTEVLCAIFTHLLTERTVLVIIDDIHHADEESLRVLVELLKIDSKSAIVMTAHSSREEAEKRTTVRKSEQRQPRSPAVQFTAKEVWHTRYQALVAAEPNVSVISVGDFTVAEINSMLQTIPGSGDFPPNLPALVTNLAGGEFFWVKEIMHFLHENGSKQFLSTIGNEADTGGPGASGGEGLSGTQSILMSRVNSAGSISVGSTVSAVNRKIAAGASSGSLLESHSVMEHLKLEQLVVCRFENMNLATKQVLRTASIIGAAFSRQVLYGVLPKSLKTDTTNCLSTLVQQQWILRSETEPDTYEFRHVYTHQIIYNITPESERRNLHKVIADYIEEISAGDASQAAQLSYHFGMCDTDKALFYTYQATMFLLENGSFFELSECAELLYQAVEYCHTPHSVEVLIKLVKEVIKSTAAIPPSRHPLLSLLARYLCSCLCGRSAAVHVIESSSNRPISSLAQQQQVSGGEVAAGANAQMHIGHSHITAFEGDHTEAQDRFLDQLQNLLALLAAKKHRMSSEKHSHKAKEWEKVVLQNSKRIRDKPHGIVNNSARFSNVALTPQRSEDR